VSVKGSNQRCSTLVVVQDGPVLERPEVEPATTIFTLAANLLVPRITPGVPEVLQRRVEGLRESDDSMPTEGTSEL
jgi:hypothetical protein